MAKNKNSVVVMNGADLDHDATTDNVLASLETLTNDLSEVFKPTKTEETDDEGNVTVVLSPTEKIKPVDRNKVERIRTMLNLLKSGLNIKKEGGSGRAAKHNTAAIQGIFVDYVLKNPDVRVQTRNQRVADLYNEQFNLKGTDNELFGPNVALYAKKGEWFVIINQKRGIDVTV